VGATPQALAVVFSVMIALMVGTAAYNRAFNQERLERAHEHYLLGRTLADYGYQDQAIDQFSDALLYQRDNFDYRLGLALALFHDRRYQEAEYQLVELRGQDPTDATTNRLLGRLAARDGRFSQAANYYRTAIYGRWPRNTEQNRLATRFELVDLLVQQGSPSQVTGEYLTIWEEEPHSPALARRVGIGLLESGAPREALAVLGSLGDAAGDAELLKAIGAAYFADRDYIQGRTYLSRAARADPADDSLRERLRLLDHILALDPTVRGLAALERYTRSERVLERTAAYVGACANPLGDELAGPPAPRPKALDDLLGDARERLGRQRRPPDLMAATESNLLLASNLWSMRDQVCRGVWDEDDVLMRVMNDLDR
jgi:tetratricopeptide (TPR) repeat protein